MKKLNAKFPNSCRVCGEWIDAGTEVYWEPGKGIHHAEHGEGAQALAPKAKPLEAKGVQLGDPAEVLAMFEKADKHLKRPKIRLEVQGVGTIKLYRGGANSAAPGAINVVDDVPFGHGGMWYGRLTLGGLWQGGSKADRAAQQLVEQFVAQLLDDPEATAVAHGKLTGSCCFCARTLTDERSTVVGYGPVCAGRWGLPWGKKETT